jgi:hypothetical protein
VTACRRINMWSGPRNVSTAMMYSWRQRSDTAVWDEPMYGHYLAHTGLDHPERDLILASVPTHAAEIMRRMADDPCPAPVWFFKNMAHHLAGFDWSIVDRVEGFLLTRDPRDQLPSLAAGLGRVPDMQDAAYEIQVRIVDRLLAAGKRPIVVDSKELLDDPSGILEALCRAVELPFEEAMLSWPAGPKPEDGVWASHWYTAVHATTGFGPYRAKRQSLPAELRAMHERCVPLYARLREFAVTG